MNIEIDIKKQRATVPIDDKIDEEAVLAAAHAFSARAEIWSDDGSVELRVGGKDKLDGPALEALGREFAEELVAQELRRRIAGENRSVREYLITQALLAAANEQGQQPADSQLGNLSEDQEGEIQRLIEEAESELGGAPNSKGGNATPGGKGEGGEGQDEPLDPKDILKSWEAKKGA